MLGDFIHSNFDKTPVKDKAKRRQLNKVSSSPDSTVECTKHDLEDIELLSQIDSGSPHRDLKHKFKEFVGHFDHTPNFLQFNHFLRTGYRINFNTPRKVFKSLFMLHNESVNIWTHLCGAIALIIISVFLCFSVNSFDSHSLQIFVKEEVQTIFNPIYHSLPNFTISENDFPEKMLHAREDTVKIGDSTLSNFEMTLHSISEEIKHVKENLSPKAIGIFLNKLRDELDDYSNMFQGGLKSSITFSREKKEKIRQMTERVETELNELQSKLVKKIDSDAFDWIDIYRYIDASYNSALRSENEYLKVPISRWPIIVFMLSAVFCLLCSAVYHAFHCMSTKASDVLSRLDYAGISILITGSCFPAFVYGFYCQPFYSKLYLSLIGVTSVIVFIVSLGEKIHTFEYSVQKSCMYASLVFFAILPSSHLIYLNITATEGSDNLDFIPSIPYYLTMILCYLIGLIIYATKYPEKCCPGKFDILGHSHQIWHVCILFGIFFTYLGAFDNYYTRIKIPCVGCGL